ncbi:MAG: nucleotidyltransferase family protein [Lachnospiraceae bacterium]|nr:nucleotidyltransferase family protein [Lachnospiraceae bacterium]
MTTEKYLANLVLSQLNGTKPENLPHNIKVNELIDIAERNHMNYLIFTALIKTDNIPEELLKRLRQLVQKSVIITLAQVTELKSIVNAFEKAGIKNQPMKGSYLKFMYPSPEMREMSDIDILVDDTKMSEAGEIMNKLGYTLVQSIKHHDIYSKKPFMLVEVHRAMYDKTVDGNQYDYFKSFNKAVLEEGKKYTYNFGKEDFYVYMLAHMAKHFYAMGCGIRNLVDVYIYLEKYGKELDRNYLNKELKKCGIYDFAVNIEELAYIWLGGKIGNQFYDDLFQYMVDCGIYGKDENGIWHKFAEEKLEGKKVTRGKLKRWYYFPPLFYMAEYYPWLEKFPVLLPVAWGIRAFRGVFMKKGVQKREMLNVIDGEKAKTYQDIYRQMKLKFKHK